MTSPDITTLLSRHVRTAELSPIAVASQQAARLQAQGRSIVVLTAGEPDFDTPLPIQQAAIEALARGETRYTATPGTLALRQAIARAYARDAGLTYAPDELIVSNGGKQIIYQAFKATLDEDDEVILPAPWWPTFPDSVRICGGTPVAIPTRAEDGFRITPAQLEQAIGPRTKWLLLNSPANPTGTVYPQNELQALAQVLRRHPHVLILWDEMYEQIWFTPSRPTHWLQAAPDLKERTLLVNGVSKTFAMTGWRIGWGAGPAPLVKALIAVQSQVSSGPNAFSQAAAQAALDGVAADFVLQARQAYAERARFITTALQAVPGLQPFPPQGAFFAWVGCAGWLGARTPDGRELTNDQDVSQWLLEHGVAVVHGAPYGLSPYFRLSFAASLEALEEAARRIAQAGAALTLRD
ncbi:aminotransferase class I/II-fold pyridoxal phosphate-dependent enzyme [Corticimicrobacter populi]|uniref:Aminotransferase n=1 Tax=Corticimicrobacter populi TaxID=2175229 RepID=A0A2V1JTB6_9BURK|nr:aminotransferase class I/II-fold pyridoxal phosphate-dependent enzyme [Corticimicrobacter populi]PWF20862.1 aspartate transaminase [Corticimicrobacter populi]